MPLVAEEVTSEEPRPVDPIAAVPPLKIGTKVMVELYGGVKALQTRLEAMGAELFTVSAAGLLVTLPAIL